MDTERVDPGEAPPTGRDVTFESLRWERRDPDARSQALGVALALHAILLSLLLARGSQGPGGPPRITHVFFDDAGRPPGDRSVPSPTTDAAESPEARDDGAEEPAGTSSAEGETGADVEDPTAGIIGDEDDLGPVRQPDVVIVLENPDAGAPRVAGAGGVSVPQVLPHTVVEPVYPEQARGTAVSGWVVVRITVSEDGVARGFEVLHTPAPGLGFEEAFLAAVKNWRFEPSTYRGRPVAALYTLAWEFKPPA